MSTPFAITTILEITAVLLLIWGFMNEKKFIAFEDKLAVIIGKTIVHMRRRKIKERRKEQAQKLHLQRTQENVARVSGRVA